MNPPGGISLLIHIFIIILGAIRRFIKNILKPIGFSDSRTMRKVKQKTGWLKNAFIQQTLAYTIILGISLTILFSVFLLSKGVLENNSNISFIINTASFYEKKMTK